MFQKDGSFVFRPPPPPPLPLLSSLFLSFPLSLSLCLFVSSSPFLSLPLFPLSSSLLVPLSLLLSFFNVHSANLANYLKTKELRKRHF